MVDLIIMLNNINHDVILGLLLFNSLILTTIMWLIHYKNELKETKKEEYIKNGDCGECFYPMSKSNSSFCPECGFCNINTLKQNIKIHND